MDAYATVEDLGSKWDDLTGGARDDVEAALVEASVIVKTALTRAGMDPDEMDADLLKLVVCRMVRRAFPADQVDALPVGLESTQMSLGSFQQTLRWGGGRSGELLLYRNERDMLGIRKKAFTIDLMPDPDTVRGGV